ncbi:hypothetical protein [Methylobacterium nodulans]|uniref:Uncharacterized protein n=1 Tax=Methylobacterium nodulans (strain LMG 21967 / CNCM I-2342 / ORS 2060) TaxID=460265 RepID=B8IRF0_METNO|nr:hypothetical protein [Methylobacterium nodulans]ACL58690.1 hypothetical protein Mnod_3785 [Methylobacterium nodulans ORS 2060]
MACRVFSRALALLGALQTAGCAQYLDRKETVALSAGDAVQTNIVTHMIDPWPRHARQRDIAFSGERLQRAVERYRTGQDSNVRQPGAYGTTNASPPTSTGAGADAH